MKILQIVKTSEGATWAYNQAEELKKNGIDIITIMPDDAGKIAKEYKQSNMKIIINDFSLPIKKPWTFFRKKRELLKIIKDEKPDIIHFHFVTNILFARIALRKDKTPRLFQVPGPLHLENRLIRKIEISLAKQNDYWAPACIFSKNIYEKYVNKDHVFLAYYGTTCINNFISSNKIHKEYNISDSKKIIAMVSYFYKPKYYLGQTRGIKGHEDFIDAIEILNKKYNNIIALVVGGPWGKSQKYEEKVKKYANKKHIENIIFTGFRNDIKEIYKEFDIAVHPSHSENLGGAAESLAAGVPTVSTNVGGFPDIVIDGKTGYTCFPGNPTNLANSIEKMILNEEYSVILAKNGQEKVKKILNIEETANKIKNIYFKLINDNGVK